MRGVLLQVRLDSTRLPGKALLKIGDYTVIEHAMASLKKVNADIHIVVTTTDSKKKLSSIVKKSGFELFIGSKNNVLKRYVDAVNYYKLDQIVRATGDNPLVFHTLANKLIDIHNTEKNDYSGFLNNPIGTGVEVVESKALISSLEESTCSYDLEHVTPYIYKNKRIFKVFQRDAPKEYLLPNTFATIDTIDDFNRIAKLYKQLYYGQIISHESVIKWLKEEQLLSTPT